MTTTFDLTNLPDDTVNIDLGEETHEVDTIELHTLFWEVYREVQTQSGGDTEGLSFPWKSQFAEAVLEKFGITLTPMQAAILGGKVNQLLSDARKN
ncbi:MAG: hypothetical protein ACTSVR_08400 [Candidatus Thorarchaeota archaeon]